MKQEGCEGNGESDVEEGIALQRPQRRFKDHWGGPGANWDAVSQANFVFK